MAAHLAEQLTHLGQGEHHRQPARISGGNDLVQPRQRGAEDDAIEKEQRRLGLALRGRSDLALDRQVSEKRGDLVGAEIARMTAAVEMDEAADPVDVGRLGAYRVVAQPDLVANALQQPGRARDGRRCGPVAGAGRRGRGRGRCGE